MCYLKTVQFEAAASHIDRIWPVSKQFLGLGEWRADEASVPKWVIALNVNNKTPHKLFDIVVLSACTFDHRVE